MLSSCVGIKLFPCWVISMLSYMYIELYSRRVTSMSSFMPIQLRWHRVAVMSSAFLSSCIHLKLSILVKIWHWSPMHATTRWGRYRNLFCIGNVSGFVSMTRTKRPPSGLELCFPVISLNGLNLWLRLGELLWRGSSRMNPTPARHESR